LNNLVRKEPGGKGKKEKGRQQGEREKRQGRGGKKTELGEHEGHQKQKSP